MSPTPVRPILLRSILAAAASVALHADIQLKVERPSVHSEQSTRLDAHHDDHHRAHWRWTVLEHGGGTIHPGPGGTATYHAPRTLVPLRVLIQVFDEKNPLHVAIREILVLPGQEADLMAWVWDRDWMTPRMTLFAGDPESSSEGPAAIFSSISQMVLVQDPAMPPEINGHLVVGDAHGLQLVSEDGKVRPWLGSRPGAAPGHGNPDTGGTEGRITCTAIAARPPDSRESNPRHLVYAETRRDPNGTPDDWTVRFMEVLPDGTTRFLAGGRHGYQDGAGPEARFGYIAGMTMDPEGNLFVLDTGNRVIRRISPTGTVTTLAGRPNDSLVPIPQADGRGAAATFNALSGITRDPGSGDLLVTDSSTVRRVTQAGDVTKILGSFHIRDGFLPPSPDPAAPVPFDYPCLSRPADLLLQGRNLFICDEGNQALRVFDLDCRTLTTLCGGHGSGHHLRKGPLPYYSPGRPAESYARVPNLRRLAFSASGTLLCGNDCAIGEIEAMPHFQSPARLASPSIHRHGSHGHDPDSSSSSSSSSTTHPPKETKESKR